MLFCQQILSVHLIRHIDYRTDANGNVKNSVFLFLLALSAWLIYCMKNLTHGDDNIKNSEIRYRIMEYFRVAKFSRFCLKNMGIIFRGFNFRGRQCPRKITLILFRKNHRVGGGTTQLSLDRSTVRKENLRPKYLKCNGIKDTCSLTDKQTKRTYLYSDEWIKWLFGTKQWNVCLACLLRWSIRHVLS